jgi:hypothetical protein
MSINKEDKVLYIIGNGFDLNLGLKTSYNNFFEYTGILTMRKVVEELKKNRNIENYDEVKLSEFIENLKKHILIDENDVYLLELKKNIKMQDTEKIRDSMYSFQRKIFITLKSEKTDNFIDDYGLFIIFLILMETEKDNEWQWVEEKILSYIEELIELLSNNFEETAMYIKNNLIEVEKKIENFINTIVKEKDVKKAKKIIETDFKYKEIENINDFIEIQKFSLKKMEKIFSNTKESKYVINFNYTDYLDKIAKKVNIIEIKYIHGDVKYTNNTILVNKDNNRSLRFQKTRDKMIVNNIRETLKYLRKFNNIINITKKIQKEIEMTLFLNVFRDKSKILKKLNLEIEINCNNLKKYIKKLYELGQYGLMMEVENSYILKMLNEEIKEKIKQILDYNNTRNITKFNMESILLECKESFEKNIESCTKKINDESVKKNSNIIFGIDKTQIKNFKNELKDFIKSNRRKNMELEWKQLLNEHKFTKIYFYGHSLADADYTFFEDLFNMIDITTNSTTKLIFLYSKGYSYEKNVKKLIGTYYFEKFKSEGKLELIEI